MSNQCRRAEPLLGRPEKQIPRPLRGRGMTNQEGSGTAEAVPFQNEPLRGAEVPHYLAQGPGLKPLTIVSGTDTGLKASSSTQSTSSEFPQPTISSNFSGSGAMGIGLGSIRRSC
jgi:hypothetical protein